MAVLTDPSCKIIIADPSATTRQAMAGVLRSVGYTEVMACESLEEVLGILAKEPYDWLLTSLFAASKVNALHLLLSDAKMPTGLHVTLCASDSELAFVLRAFSLGLFSFLAKPFTRDQFKAYVDSVRDACATYHNQPSLMAATTLRALLRSQHRYDELLALESQLATTFPDEAQQLLPLAEVLLETGQTQRAQSLLWLAQERDERLREAALRLGEAYISNGSGEWAGSGTAVVIDPDDAARNACAKVLTAAGAPCVEAFADGASCWQWLLTNGAPDLIVMEWRLPQLSGPGLLQRLRAHGYYETPVILVSSLVKRSDLAILGELGVLSIIEKPMRGADLVSTIAWTLRQKQRPSEEATMEQRITALLAAGKVAEARAIMELYKKSSDPASAKRKYLEAAFALQDQNFSAARDLASASISLGNRSVSALNLLGKALMHLREFDAALRIFAKASDIAPGSIERLCAIAESHAELGDTGAALAHAEEALNIDPQHPSAIKTGINIALVSGNAELLKDLTKDQQPSVQVLAFLNNKAVAVARSGDVAQATSLYENALKALPQGRDDLRGVVLYNLALAQIQAGDGKKALASLLQIRTTQKDQQGQKVRSLIERTREAVKAGRVPKLRQGLPPPEVWRDDAQPAATGRQPAAAATAAAAKHPLPYFLKGLFIEEKPDDLVDALLTALPQVQLRRPA